MSLMRIGYQLLNSLAPPWLMIVRSKARAQFMTRENHVVEKNGNQGTEKRNQQ